MSQQDLFISPAQTDLFPGEMRGARISADPDRVRARLLKIIAEAKAADTMPWNSQHLRYLRTVVPQMVNWLPDEEAAQLRFAFDEEVKRLELLGAA